MKLGLFGGSFDPVHLGHLFVAQAAMEELGLDRLFFIPAAQSPFKPETRPAPPAERVRWLRLALAGFCRYELDEQELHRGGVSAAVSRADVEGLSVGGVVFGRPGAGEVRFAD
jgi:nicotinate-nucleotide adenylyltransferase